MSQARFQFGDGFRGAAGKPPRLMLSTRYVSGNREAAGVILSDVGRYGGEGAALVQWALLVLERCPRHGHRQREDAA